MRYVAAIAVLLLAGACSGDSGTGSSDTNNGEGWNLVDGGSSGPDAGTSANNSSQNSGMANSGTTNGGPTNGGTTTNNGSTNNTSTNNNGGLAEGEACTLNSQCSSDLTCCAGLDGSATCSADCFTGGLCGGDDTECGADTECCDLSGINAPDTCLRRCGGGGGNNGGSGDPCDTNPDCPSGEVCCPGFDGNATCTLPDDCLSGGACEANTDCQNNQECCDLTVAKVCLDQCSF